MTLDLEQIAAHLPALRERQAEAARERQARLQAALAQATGPLAEPGALVARIGEPRTSWSWAQPLDRLDARCRSTAPPARYTVVATDGSHVAPDRHASLAYYVVNVGRVRLHYGVEPSATLDSVAVLEDREDALMVRSSADASAEERVSGALLGGLRAVRELQAVADLAEAEPGDWPVVGLLDGTLVPWALAPLVSGTGREEVRRMLIDEGVVQALDRLRAVAARRQVVVASYISNPNASEVVHALRLASCPLLDRGSPTEGVAWCERCPRGGPAGGRDCDRVGAEPDARPFRRLLAPGERSGVFLRRNVSRDAVEALVERAGHPVGFAYCNVGPEVARLEFPLWALQSGGAADLLHAVVQDQATQGAGYPVALQEAHEQAVITAHDRGALDGLLERTVGAALGWGDVGAKRRSKLRRAV